MTDRTSVVPQLLGAAVGIVLGAAVLFALVGTLRGDDPTPEVVAGEDTATAPADDTADAEDDPAEDAPAEDGTEDAPAEDGTEDAPADGTEDAEDAGDAEDAATPADEPTEEPTEAVDPAEVSIQVLDAVGGDGGSAVAEEVAEELREAGYDVVVVNRAGRGYDVTTIFWSPEQEAAGRQVAAFLGAERAEPTPDEVSLSDSVDVHVVVGADRA